MTDAPSTGPGRPPTTGAGDLSSTLRRSLAMVDAARARPVPVPDDAAEHADALAAVLQRIPDGWGRWISHGAGWYPIVARLDRELAALEPGYVLHQVKEKFGVLRYYWDFAELPMPCCDRWQAAHPAPAHYAPAATGPEALTALQEQWRRWWAARDEHDASAEHQAALAVSSPERERRAALRPRMDALVDAAESASAQTCEQCGTAGQMWERTWWVKTLCDGCADTLGYTTRVPPQARP